MRNYLNLTLGIIGIFLLAGCATIMSHGPQAMSIISDPDGADCEIVDMRAGVAIIKAKTPHVATLDRGDGFFLRKHYDIKLTKEGFIPESATIVPQISGWYFCNLIFGGGIGAIIVDPATGAMWTFYDREVRFRMFPDTPEGHEARNLALAQAEEERRRVTEARRTEGSGMYGNPN